ncbi:MAG TPA: Do family serine endopeptidase [Myxococcota bacterium]|jgi:serine protease Do|nr:Do family serine endopeptidase [Myxococcota bacterium]
MKSFARVGVVLGAALIALVITGAVDIDVKWRDGVARAIDLFGSDEPPKNVAAGDATAGAGSFWTDGATAQPIAPVGVPTTFADLAERVSPGVVNISTKKTVVAHSLEDFFPFPFQDPFGGQGGMPPGERKQQVPSLGTGFVISQDGYIVTNNHVIEDVDSITVRFADGKELPAEIVGRDPKTDIALIRVTTDQPVFALPLGDSESVRPGEWVVAIGNPFGLEHTVTAGIVSAKHRNIEQGMYDDYIQTDAAINPGNSGGPLLNLAGAVIGINTAINPRANTIGFAVPINMAKDILPQLRADGRVTRGWLGVVIQKITPEIAEEFDLDEPKGALVSKVVPDGPAADAGVEQRDVIRRFDGQPIDDFDDLPRLVARTPVDKKVSIVVIRDGKEKELTTKVGALEEPEIAKAAATASPGGSSAFGLRVQDLTPELAEQLGLEGNANGVVVSAVEPGGPAGEAGLRRGDVIVEVDRHEVQDSGALEKRLEETDDRALLLVRRGDSQLYVPLKRRAS